MLYYYFTNIIIFSVQDTWELVSSPPFFLTFKISRRTASRAFWSRSISPRRASISIARVSFCCSWIEAFCTCEVLLLRIKSTNSSCLSSAKLPRKNKKWRNSCGSFEDLTGIQVEIHCKSTISCGLTCSYEMLGLLGRVGVHQNPLRLMILK